ncbi:GNAT family N-acetyltransferase [Streptomyces sp. BR123]|uniref:GNAT family N-acetyltransferase n=1 Tax=Streptomyces sp. BR123 TaxID=2749828 RepID=UPI0015C45707|nr:GNAT family N-acetyltransferase [Streptomyces sp. BR123]NXY94268.1 GNAT family N-acetyltransferase [Streptomyces sp. BR123]
MIVSIPDVVPPGRLAGAGHPVFSLPCGLRLRPWARDDAPVLAASCHDPDVQHWNRPGHLTLDAARERIARWEERRQAEEAVIWAIAEPDGDRPVGLIGMADVDLRDGSAEFLYWLLPAGRGRGAMVDAVARVSRWALEDLGLHRLRITHSVANAASCAVATRTGFALEGTLRSALLHADGWHDEHLHARVQGDPPPVEQAGREAN